MKEMIYQLPQPETAWPKFLDFDAQISHTTLQECQTNHIAVCPRSETDTVAELAEKVARTLGLDK